MAHHNTVFAQMLKFIPTCLSRQRHESKSLVKQHYSGYRLRKMALCGHGGAKSQGPRRVERLRQPDNRRGLVRSA